jgi:transposase-like protein
MPNPARISAEVAEAIAAGMPKCPICGGQNVRPAHPIRLEDKVRAWFKYTPFRCRSCQHRFYDKRAVAREETSSVTAPPTSN